MVKDGVTTGTLNALVGEDLRSPSQRRELLVVVAFGLAVAARPGPRAGWTQPGRTLGFADRANAAKPVKATIKRGVLTVEGTAGAEAITLRLQAGDPNTIEVDVGADGAADFSSTASVSRRSPSTEVPVTTSSSPTSLTAHSPIPSL